MNRIQLPWSIAGCSVVPALWLRDNCPCDHCRVAATTEHRIVIGTQPEDLQPQATAEIDGAFHVDWGDHQSVYDAAWLEQVRADADRPLPTPTHWDANLDLPRHHYDDLDDARAFLDFCDDVARYGVALVEGVPEQPGTVEQFISRWAPVREVPFGRVHDVLVDPSGYNIAHSAEALPPHNDMASILWPPSGQLIHMLCNDAVGGDSLVVDGWAVCDRLTEADIETLATVPAAFRQFSGSAETWAKAPLIRRNPDGSIAHLRFSNQLLQPMDPFAPDTERFYEAYHHLSAAVLDERLHHRFRCNGGDMMVLHGHRVLHGRTAFRPSTGSRHLQDVYFEFEDLMNRAFRVRNGTLADAR